MGNFLRVVLVVLLVFLGFTNDSHQEHHHHNHREHHPETDSGGQVCANLRSGLTATPRATVQVVGVLSEKLILLSNSKEVYSIPLGRISQSGIDLSGIRPEPLATKWPNFVRAHNFDFILDPSKRIGLFTMQYQDERQVIIAANYSDRNVGFVTVTAEVSPQEKVSIVSYKVPQSVDGFNWVYFSSKEPNIFYSASRDPDLSVEFFREYTASPGNATSFTMTARRLLCSQIVDNNTKVRFFNVPKGHELCNSFLQDWTAPEIQIFTDSANFYLFNNKKVYVIPYEAYQNPGKAVTLGEFEYSNFLRCQHQTQGSSHEPEPWPNQFSKSSHRSTNRGLTIFIYAGIGAGAILIIAIVSACFCACSKPNPAQPGAGEEQSAKFMEENLKSKSNDGKEAASEAEAGAGESNAAGGSENSKGDAESSAARSSNAKSSSAAGGGKSAASNAGGGSSSNANGGAKSSSSSAKPPKKAALKGKMKKMKSIRASSASRSEAESSSQRSAKPKSKKTKKGKKMPTEKSSKSKQATKKKKKQNK